MLAICYLVGTPIVMVFAVTYVAVKTSHSGSFEVNGRGTRMHKEIS